MKKLLTVIIGILFVWLITLLPPLPQKELSITAIPVILLGVDVIYFIMLCFWSDDDPAF
jgi:hypothetical protein